MGKDDKEDSGFGFKDKQKALDTLKLLEEHDLNYRRLTVRGLLGRAKRVLSLTKAPDKVKNIKEAMEVFEQWLAELAEGKEQKSEKKREEKREEKQNGDDIEPQASDPKQSDSVPNLGFKDKEAANLSLKELEGRDPDYQKLAVKGLIGRAKRVLTCTKDETKLSNIKEAISIFEKFLDDFETKNLAKQNNSYLDLNTVKTWLKVAEEKNIGDERQKAFIAAYSSVSGDYKKLRTVAEQEGGKTWDIVRNEALKTLKEKLSSKQLFTEDNLPTDSHLQYILWAYTPEVAKLKKASPEVAGRKRKSSGGSGGDVKKSK